LKQPQQDVTGFGASKVQNALYSHILLDSAPIISIQNLIDIITFHENHAKHCKNLGNEKPARS